ncbi:MAG: dTDP-glucose 4,6-dehydratase, partial [Chloroflexota bacterium]
MGEERAFGRLLVTGGAGFIGSCYVRDVLARRDGTRITVLDKLTYAGNEANLAPVRDDPEMAARLGFVRGDIADPAVVGPLVADADAVVNFAAESHVDRSILDPEAFLATGVIGVHVLLEACRTAAGKPRFLQVSTDEVYGSVADGHAAEDAPLAPRSPYAAAKAAGELLVASYVVTHGIDAVVTRGSNTYGPFHHPEKLIPLFITNAIDDRELPLYGDGLQRREWLYVSDHAAAIDHVLRHGTTGETYNVPGPAERTNREVVTLLLELLGKPWSLVREV